MKIIFATNNKHKVADMQALLQPKGFTVVSLRDEGIKLEIEEKGTTFSENARIKAETIHKITRQPVIADDSGLEVYLLNGEPGIYSARYGGEGLTDKDRCSLILQKLNSVPREDRRARFVCAVHCIIDDTQYSSLGTIEGWIGERFMGSNGFGYDPIFMVNDTTSMAMLAPEEKNAVSHRHIAIENLLNEMNRKKT